MCSRGVLQARWDSVTWTLWLQLAKGDYTYCMPAKLGGQVVGVHVSDYPSQDHLHSQWDCGDICSSSCKLNVCVFPAALREVNGQRHVSAPVASLRWPAAFLPRCNR